MFSDGAQRKFDVILFWSLDRFSREGAYETLTHLRRLDSAGIGFKSYTEQYLDSCGLFKEAIISILATLAKQERIRLSERTLAGLERARANGVRLGRPAASLDLAFIRKRRRAKASWRAIGREVKVSPATLKKALQSA